MIRTGLKSVNDQNRPQGTVNDQNRPQVTVNDQNRPQVPVNDQNRPQVTVNDQNWPQVNQKLEQGTVSDKNTCHSQNFPQATRITSAKLRHNLN